MSRNGGWAHRRFLTGSVLAAFIFFPAASAWTFLDADVTSNVDLAFKKRPPSQRHQGSRTIRKGWMRKGLRPSITSVVEASRPKKAPSWEPRPPWRFDLTLHNRPTGLNRLKFTPEFTKPASLIIRLAGTPKNHRSPPA
jgi:hypothetical protein